MISQYIVQLLLVCIGVCEPTADGLWNIAWLLKSDRQRRTENRPGCAIFQVGECFLRLKVINYIVTWIL